MDLVTINYQCRTVQGLDDERTRQEMAKIVHEEIKQMTSTEFLNCFSSALINIDTKNYEISLIFPANL